nr:G-type lectin S-receptor-like serine/threonine-protein kinase At4g27290 isoform X1 [Tanacetum cinerariifolium]
MPDITIPLVFICLVISGYLKLSYAADTLTVNGSLRDGEMLSSAGGTFELGFFSPGNSTNRYVGIWYKNVSPPIVVWVANRKNPIIKQSGVLMLVGDPISTLIILAEGVNHTIWKSLSNVSNSIPILQLLDSGNLVVTDEHGISKPGTYHWQSFDYPVDTLLPGMKLGRNLKTGFETYLSSWTSVDDPSPGDYTYHCDPTGYPQILMRKNLVTSFRLGSWNGLGFSGTPCIRPAYNISYTFGVVINEMEMYYMFSYVANSTNLFKLKLAPSGIAEHSWVTKAQGSRVFYSGPADQCDEYSSDGFRKYFGLKLPDARSSWYNTTMSLDECEAKCFSNCSCMAYAALNILDGSGCLLWFGDLIDMRDLSENVQDLYVRMASSESDHSVVKSSSGTSDKKDVIIKVALPILIGTVLLALSLIMYYRRKKKISQLKMQAKRAKINEMQMEEMELQLFDLPRITSATRNFSVSCKLGEGGFGPVYKGILDEGQEIAVKRLSKTSGQGLEEFKNEVVCIAKLQHRNLVKLLGYCLENDEMMKLLDWPKRYHIINGVARGLLYLHHDSRLRIIHRDLKASNILLDSDMNPKISDFGLARRFRGNEMGANTKMAVGTYGYMSPEYAVHGLFSVKSDVFSFGVVLLEIVSGKKNRGFFEQDHSDNLLGHVWRLYKEGRSMELIDATLLESLYVSEALRSVQVGLLCVQHSPIDRPNMSSVVLMLSGEGTLPEPKQPGFFTQDNILQAQFSVNEVTITCLDGR